MRNHGFTLMEAMMSVALVTILAGIGVPIYRTFQIRKNADLSVQVITQTLRGAQLSALSRRDDSSWGVYFEVDRITLFQGESYSERDQDKDEVHIFPNSVELSGVTETVFVELTGLPSVAGEVTVTSVNDLVNTVTINAVGMIEYD